MSAHDVTDGMEDAEFSHMTFVVRDLDATLEAYEALLFLTTEGIVEELDDARLATIHFSGLRLEFIEPDTDVPSPFTQFLEERGEGIISYCIVIENFDEEIERLKDQGVSLQEAEQPDLFPDHTLRLAWILPEEHLGCRVEIVDKDSLPPSEVEIIESGG